MANNSSIDITITATDLASGTVKAVNSSLGQLQGTQTNTTKSTSGLTGAFLKANIAFEAIKWGAQRLSQGLVSVAEEGSKLKQLQISTQTIAQNIGRPADEVEKLVKQLEATNTFGTKAYGSIKTMYESGLINLVDGLQRTDKATGKVVNGFDAFILTAKDFGANAGISSGEAIENINSALTRLSPELLENMGIQINLAKLWQENAGELKGLSGEELTLAQRQIMLNAIMEQGSKVAGVYEASFGGSLKNMNSLKDAIIDIKSRIGAGLEPTFAKLSSTALSFTKDVLKPLATTLAGELNTALTNGMTAIQGIYNLLATGTMSDEFKKMFNTDETAGWFQLFTVLRDEVILFIDNVKRGIDEITTFWNTNLKPIFDMIGAIWNETVLPAIAQVRTAYNDMMKEMGLGTEGQTNIILVLVKAIAYTLVGAILVVTGIVTGLSKAFTFVFEAVKAYIYLFKEDWNTYIVEPIRKAIDWVKQLVDAIKNINIGEKVSQVWNNIFGHAYGGITSGSPILVGERGPEIIVPPAGSRVIPNGQTGQSAGNTYNISINAPVYGVDNFKQTILDAVETAQASQNAKARYNLA